MKVSSSIALCSLGLLAGALHAADPAGAPAAAAQPARDPMSYRFGLNVGNTLKRQAPTMKTEDLVAGLKESLSQASGGVSPAELEPFVKSLEQLIAVLAAKGKEQAEKSRKEAQVFLEANAKKEGVVKLPSGLQYRILKKGTGDSPKATDTVSVNYRGTLVDGTEFDSSYKRNEPAKFPLSNVIKGWTEGLQLMQPGAKYEFVIPSDLAYGPSGAGNTIPPYATLIFEVELLTVEKK